MKGAAFHLPLRPIFIQDLLIQYDKFTATHPDAHASMVAWELFDPSIVVASPDAGSFANRGWHLNSLVMPMWTKEENDGPCRQWAREMSGRFKVELEEVHGAVTGEGPSVRGHKGAVLLYGNYDVSVCFIPFPSVLVFVPRLLHHRYIRVVDPFLILSFFISICCMKCFLEWSMGSATDACMCVRTAIR